MNLNTKRTVLPALVVSVSSSLLAGVAVSRALGVASFSDYSKLLAVTGLACIVVDAGSTIFGIQNFHSSKFSMQELMSSILFFRIAGFGFAAVALISYLTHIGYGPVPIVLLVLSIATGVVSQEWLLVAQQSTASVYLLRAVPSAFVVGSVLLFRSGNLSALISYRLVGLIAQAVAGIVLSRASLSMPRRVASFSEIKPIFFSAALSQIYTSRLDLLILARTASTQGVASYAVLSNYFAASGSVLSSLMLRNLSKLTSPINQKIDRTRHDLSEFWFFGGALGIGIILLANDVTSLTYGRNLASSVVSLGCISGAVWISFAGGSVGVQLLARGLNRRVQYVPLVPAVINISANLLLTSRLGAAGSSLAMLLSEALNVVALFWIWRSVVNADPKLLPQDAVRCVDQLVPTTSNSTVSNDWVFVPTKCTTGTTK